MPGELIEIQADKFATCFFFNAGEASKEAFSRNVLHGQIYY